MNKKNYTPIFIFSIVALIAVYDVYIIMDQTNRESISAHLLSMGEVTPFIPCLLGFTFGHLTWPNKNSFLHKTSFRPYSYIFFALTAPPAIYDVVNLYITGGETLIENYDLSPVFPFLISYVLGHFLWPMNPDKWSGRFKK